jgi:uncharacterized protein YceK
MIKAVSNFCRRTCNSQIGQLLLVTHLVLVIYVFAQIPTDSNIPCTTEFSSVNYVAGRMIHMSNESTLFQVIALLDIPAMLTTGVFSTLFLPLNLCAYTMSWIIAILLILFASLQWLLIGFGIQEFVQSLRKKS